MTKKSTVEEVVEVLSSASASAPTQQDIENSARWARTDAIEKALAHHKINGGMLTPDQLIDNARKFHAYITGETK